MGAQGLQIPSQDLEAYGPRPHPFHHLFWRLRQPVHLPDDDLASVSLWDGIALVWLCLRFHHC